VREQARLPQAAYVGLGANLDDPIRQVQQALRELGDLAATKVVTQSSLYRTAPVGFADQPPFVNAVAHLETSLAPRALFDELKQIEHRHGRRRGIPNGPRTLDLDLLIFADQISFDENLTIPHPRMHARAFVLVPLAEIAAELNVPGQGRVIDLLQFLDRRGVEKISVVEKCGAT
jgi:2-amino-4-hydroxy-6-hydroxymethyldihydropteridine diphosphokinase